MHNSILGIERERCAPSLWKENMENILKKEKWPFSELDPSSEIAKDPIELAKKFGNPLIFLKVRLPSKI